MLDLFKRPTDPPEYSYLYAIPAVLFTGAFIWAASSGLGGMVQSGYFISTMLSIGALTGLASQVSFALMNPQDRTYLNRRLQLELVTPSVSSVSSSVSSPPSSLSVSLKNRWSNAEQ